MAIPKGVTFRLIAGSRAVNEQVESVPWSHPNLDEASCFLRAPTVSPPSTCYMVFGRCEESEDTFTMASGEGLFI